MNDKSAINQTISMQGGTDYTNDDELQQQQIAQMTL